MALKLVLIDGHSILNRAFYGVPELTNGQGLHTNAIFGFLNIMFRVLEDEKADYLAVAFDLKEPTFRHKMFEAYKGTRKPMICSISTLESWRSLCQSTPCSVSRSTRP